MTVAPGRSQRGDRPAPALSATARWAGERGATAVEYALMAGLIALAIVAGVTVLGLTVGSQFDAGAGLFS